MVKTVFNIILNSVLGRAKVIMLQILCIIFWIILKIAVKTIQ